MWQVSSGLNGSYADVFLRHGVALIEPGDSGTWNSNRDDAEFGGSLVRRFATEVQIGDVILLRVGISTIRAVGLVARDYLYLPQFDDVNGRDLQHARRVRWYALPGDHDFGGRVFGANAPSVSRINQPEILDYADRFVNSQPTHWQTAPLPALPEESPSIAPPDELCELVAQMQDLTSLYTDRTAFGDYPAEDEIIAHYIVPFLLALGWQVEHIAIKWRFIDMCVFRALPRRPENCQFVIEAKRLGATVENALDQAKRYVRDLGVLRDIVVTDGIRYRLYAADKDFAPVAYANLARLKQPALKLFARMKRL